LSEILGWYDERVRAQCDAESYFDATELQSDGSHRLGLLTEAVSAHHSDLTILLRRAWDSRRPAECPTLKQWRQALENVSLTKIEYTWHPSGQLRRSQWSTANGKTFDDSADVDSVPRVFPARAERPPVG
jgi:hypothetical protein